MKKIRITLTFFIALMLIKVAANASILTPSTTAEFKKTSVRIYNLKMTSGGTGSIFRSSKYGSQILTNKHVCRLIEPGGYVVKYDKKYEITHYKKFSDHDLCLIKVKKNFKINISVAKTIAKPSDSVYVSGHPSLLPHILTKGHLSDNITIELVIGVKKCTKSDFKQNNLYCMFFGGIPVLKKFESQVVSNLIKPGSSGSAVFNSNGRLVGVVFAGSGRSFSHGIIVPQKYILYFLATAVYSPFIEVGTEVSDGGLEGRIFNYNKCYKNTKVLRVKNICRKTKSNMIWRKND